MWKILKPFLTLAIVLYVFRGTDLEGIWKGIRQADPLIFVFTLFVFNVIGQSLSVWRWHFLLACNGMKIPFFKLMKFQFIGILFQVFLPSSFGGDVAKFTLVQEKGKGAETVNSLFVGRLAGNFALIVFALPGVFLFPVKDAVVIRWILLAAVFVAVLGIVMIRFPFFNFDKLEKIRWLIKPMKFLKNLRTNLKGSVLCPTFFISVLFQLISGLMFYLLFLALGLQVDFLKALLVSPLISVLSILVPSFLGIGPREVGLFYFFAGEIGTKEMLGSFSLLINAIILTQVLLGAIFWMTTSKSRKS